MDVGTTHGLCKVKSVHCYPPVVGKTCAIYSEACAGGSALTFAGLWDEWRDGTSGQRLKSCTMIITEANAFVADVHDRMPVILAANDFEAWLRGEAGVELLKPAPGDALQRWPVSMRVNSSKAPTEDPTLILPADVAV